MRRTSLRGSETRVLHPAEDDSHRLVAQQRAGTLMGGETPGGHGEVRVWAPEEPRLPKFLGRRLYLIVSLGMVATIIALLVLDIVISVPFIVYLLAMGLVYGAGTVISNACFDNARRFDGQKSPSYISTDNGGIALVHLAFLESPSHALVKAEDTTNTLTQHRLGGFSLSWDQIVGARRIGSLLWLFTRSSGTKTVNLTGYSRRGIDCLVSLIRSRANLSDESLHPDPDPQIDLIEQQRALLERSKSGWRRSGAKRLRRIHEGMHARSPIYVRPGETVTSIISGSAPGALPPPIDETASDTTRASGPDDAGRSGFAAPRDRD